MRIASSASPAASRSPASRRPAAQSPFAFSSSDSASSPRPAATYSSARCSAASAAVLQLLHSVGVEDLAKPETYDLLLAYLNHERLPVRELARWHLARLVPDGSKVAYDAAAPADQRAEGVKEWRKHVREALPKK